MKNRRSVGLLAAALAVALGVAGCGSDTGTENKAGGELKIGVIGPYSGPNAPGGEAIYQGYQLAADQANADGGVDGRQVKLVKGDAQTPEQGISEVNRLATSSKVDAFAGTYISGVSNTASKAAERYQKLYWDTNALSADLTERGLTNFVRSGPNSDHFGLVSAKSVSELVAPSLGISADKIRVFVTHEDSAYGSSIAAVQKAELKKAGVQVVGTAAYAASSVDVSSVIVRGQQAKPDLWIQTGYVPDSSLLLRTADQQGFKPKAIELVGTGDTEEFLKAVGADKLNGVLVTGYAQPDVAPAFGPGANDYLKAYDKKFGGEPNFPQTMTAYVGMKMMLNAIKEAGSADPAKVRKVLDGINEPESTYATGFGQKYDKNYQNTLALPTVLQWQGGKRITLYPKAAAQPGSMLIKAK